MSLIYCPECGHEISQAAIACPNCGRPFKSAPPIARQVVVAERPSERGGFPPWAFVPLGIFAVALLALLFYAISRNDESADSNYNVNVSTQRASTRGRDTQTITVPSDSTTITAPPTSSQTVTVPGSQTSIPSDPASTKGKVVIDAKVANRTGAPQAVKNEKFYLLDKDLDAILSDARLEPIEGQTLSNSFGLSVVYPDRYGDFNRRALAAIKDHIKYSGMTDGLGKAQLGGIEPDSYYLFGITKTGDNILNLSPQHVTEMERSSE